MQNQDLYKDFQEYRKLNPKVRDKKTAHALGVTEGQLLLARVGYDVSCVQAQQLPEFLSLLSKLGKLLVVVRNDKCVTEATGEFSLYASPARPLTSQGQLRDSNMRFQSDLFKFDICIDKVAAAFVMSTASGRHSVQLCDKYGYVVAKIYLQQKNKAADFLDLVQEFIALESPIDSVSSPASANAASIQDTAVLSDLSACNELSAVADILFALNLSAIESDLIQTSSYADMVNLLKSASENNSQLLVLLANSAAQQAYLGLVDNLKQTPGCFNIMDKEFNLHMYESIAHVRSLTIATNSGVLTILQSFDTTGLPIVTLSSLNQKVN